MQAPGRGHGIWVNVREGKTLVNQIHAAAAVLTNYMKSSEIKVSHPACLAELRRLKGRIRDV